MTTEPVPPPVAPVGIQKPARGPFPWIPLILAAIAAGATWPVLEQYHAYFQPSEKAAAEAYNFGPLNAETRVANSKNGAICFGTLGALLGLGLGLAGGLTRRSIGGAILGAVVGAVLGLAAGALPPFALMPRAHDLKDEMLSQPAIGFGIHLGLWLPIGAAAGLAYAIGRHGVSARSLLLGLFGGLIGAAIGTVFYEIFGAIVLPLHGTQNPFASLRDAVPGSWNPTRLFSLVCVAIGTALGTILAVHGSRAARKPVAPPVGLDAV